MDLKTFEDLHEIMGIMIDGDVLIFNAVPIFTPILDEYSFRFRSWGYHRGPYEFWSSELLGSICAFIFVLHDTPSKAVLSLSHVK